MHSALSTKRKDASSKATDDVLIKRLKSGQVNAIQPLYHRYARLVHTLALRIVKSTEEAEDITQEIFLVLCNQCRYDAHRGSLKNFLAMKTRSRAIDRLRSRNTHHRAIDNLRLTAATHTVTTPLDHASKTQAVQQVRNALSNLSCREREVLENAYYKDLSQSQIATQLSIPLGTVKSRSRQGLKKLRCALDEST